jgi:hypothetical protein
MSDIVHKHQKNKKSKSQVQTYQNLTNDDQILFLCHSYTVMLSFHDFLIGNLFFSGHAKCLEFMKKYNLPLMLLGGGGYTIRNVARCWTYETAVALGTEIANELPYNDYFEYFGPDFKLHISPSNMTNQNTPEYMDKIKTRLFENLRMLPHAPGVQMATIPEDGVTLKEESEAADEADPDKRNPPELKDRQIEPDNEFDGRPGKSGKNQKLFFLTFPACF